MPIVQSLTASDKSLSISMETQVEAWSDTKIEPFVKMNWMRKKSTESMSRNKNGDRWSFYHLINSIHKPQEKQFQFIFSATWAFREYKQIRTQNNIYASLSKSGKHCRQYQVPKKGMWNGFQEANCW
jgi:hypothetical protein